MSLFKKVWDNWLNSEIFNKRQTTEKSNKHYIKTKGNKLGKKKKTTQGNRDSYNTLLPADEHGLMKVSSAQETTPLYT